MRSRSGIQFQFGRAVRAARAEMGISQDALAFNAGLDRSYVGQIERGEKCPSICSAQALALALNRSLSELILAAERS